MTNTSVHAPMSDAEAKQEHDDIQREIAKGKGLPAAVDDKTDKDEKVEKDSEIEEEAEKKEPGADDEKADEGKTDDAKDSTEGDEKEESVEIPPKRTDRRIPLAKYQELKHELTGKLDVKEKEIVQLRKDLEATQNQKEVGDVVKTFAEKHNVSEEFAKDMLDMAKAAMPKADPSRDAILSKAEVFIKKQEAQEAFESEYNQLLQDVPQAADVKNKLRAEAYKDENLSRSLFEIYHRNFKDEDKDAPAPPKRGAEVTRTSSVRNGPPVFDPKKVAEDLKNNVPGALSKLTDKQVDEVFEHMEKNGSRYF